MTVNPVFGRIFVPEREIETPTVVLLQTWFPTFLREIESQLDLELNSVKVPEERNYTNRNTFDTLAGADTPLVTVISPGIMGTPQRKGNGQITATWRLGIGVACVATTEQEADRNSKIYGAAVRDIMLKKGGGAFNAHVHWLDEQYVDLPISTQLEQFRAASIWFSIDMENVATKRGGPDTPDAEPYAYHTVQPPVHIDLEKEAIV